MEGRRAYACKQILGLCQTFPSYLNSRNFILHRICVMDGKIQDTIETRLYFITFLLIDGYKDCNWTRIWVTGKVVNMLITHKNKTKKYLYDETIMDVQGSPGYRYLWSFFGVFPKMVTRFTRF